ncbi:FAD-dependent monooxygenase [Streptosporangium canum]|uniref:FAD-dependent monooxygenase n=1 Tax=Streptosporangium canum TaxID=324952 RepID=UPI003412A6DE
MTLRKAIVVGGGIGGLATALGLRRAGWQVTMLERATAFQQVGAGLTLAPNAVRALDFLGLGEHLRGRGMAQGAAGLRTCAGRWIMRTRVEELQHRFGVPAFALHRADLHSMLIDALDEVDVRTGHTVTGLPDGHTIACEGAGRSETMDADLIVAADGVHSRLREILFPGHPGPSYAGYVTWRGVVPADRVPSGVPGSLTESWGRGKRIGIIPLGDGRVYWYATRSVPEGACADADLAEVTSWYAGWHRPIPQLLAATPPEALLRNDIYTVDTPLATYVRGAVALLGDAAHAVTPDLGQGACQALEDAVTLTALLESETDLGSALTAYDQQRRPRTQQLVRASAQFGRIAQWRNPLAATVRDTLTGLVPARTYLASTAETLNWRPPITTRP